MKQAIEKTFVIIVLAFFIGLFVESVGDSVCSEEYIITWWNMLNVIAFIIAIAWAGYISGKANQ